MRVTDRKVSDRIAILLAITITIGTFAITSRHVPDVAHRVFAQSVLPGGVRESGSGDIHLTAFRTPASPTHLPENPVHIVAPLLLDSSGVHSGDVGSLACEPRHWRHLLNHLLNPDERWIDYHESTLRPSSRLGRYWGLGQMDQYAYVPTANPCIQLADEQHYMLIRYGSWEAARAWWEEHSWW